MDTPVRRVDRRPASLLLEWLLTTAVVAGIGAVPTGGQVQVPGAFTGRVVLVPVDVRVLDEDGDPVVDLTAADFVVLENGIPQEIGHFATQRHEVGDPRDAAAMRFRRSPGLEPSPIEYRTFLVVLGRGRLQGPARGLDGVIGFLREHALPQDRVGVVAYDRISEITTDRQSVINLLQRYRSRHESIENVLDQWFTGLQLVFGSRDHPPGVRRQIDEVFTSTDTLRVSRLAAPGIPGEGEFEKARQRLIDAVDRDFVYITEARDDMERLHAAVEYLRHLEGEKQLVFLSENGLQSLGPEHVDRLAAIAADARVAISVIHTSGLETSWTPGYERVFLGPSWRRRWATQDSRALAERTGGIASDYQYAGRALERLEQVTRVHYLLGYYPKTQAWDGGWRDIEVRVTRPGVRLLYRHGYFAREELVPYDRREFVTESRIAAAGAYRLPIDDIGMTLKARRSDGPPEEAAGVDVEIAIDPSPIKFDMLDGRHVANLDVAVFVGDRGRQVIGELRRAVALRLLPETYKRLLGSAEGVTLSFRIDVSGRARYVKAVAYDYGNDRLGSATVEVR